MSRIKEEVIEIEAESLDAFLKQETKRRIEEIEKDYTEGAERRIKKITTNQLIIPFGIMLLSIAVHHIVQFTIF